MPLQPTISHEAKVLEITAAAMQATMQGKAYVSYEYFAKGNEFFVAIRDKDYDFSFAAYKAAKQKVVNFEVRLSDDGVGDQLDAILAKIKEL